MPAPDEIVQLVDRFDFHRDSYVSAHYNEAQVRQEFINPLFKALGWDMDNEEGNAEAYKDVVHEDTIKVSGATKAPDYSFRVGGVRKFFVEAKKPAVNLKEDAGSAYQLRRYAWSAKLPLSILTDFQEFAVYDCRGKPSQNDKASVARVTYLTYKDYLTHWDEIAGIFSRKAIPKGSFDKYAESNKAKHGTAEVDDAFLQEMETWREELAQNIALRNPSLSQRQLNAAVQMTIDRIIFLRIAEDRGIEPYGRLFNLTTVGYIYDNLRQIFREADGRYNSGLFHFQNEAGRSEAPDALTLTLTIDDKCLKKIITSLYYPESPYEFSVLPSDILGQVYERFLGKVIRLAKHGAGHRAIVEEKPEVRKAGGVYYTPTYIVDYIVKHTLGKWLEGKRTKEVENLKVLDPACGSGSFLLVAYQYLLDWHRDEYKREGTRKHRKELQETETGEWRLTTAERKRILLNNIYGVDIDAQAVEVTKLSLLLKVLEGETKQAIDTQLSFLHERALPDLADNIKWGNSLIGSNFYNKQQTDFLDDEETYRVNPFDWEEQFPRAFARTDGGFDVVVGNPPYGAYLSETEKSYLASKFSNQNYQLDSYLLFLEQAVTRLMNPDGYYGMIIPNTWLTNLSQERIRRFVTTQTRICQIAHFLFPVFPRVTVDTEIVVLQKSNPERWQTLVTVAESRGSFLRLPSSPPLRQAHHEQQKWRSLDGGVINIFLTQADDRLKDKCSSVGVAVTVLCAVNVGIKPYETGKGNPPQTKDTVANRPFDSDWRIDATYRLYLRGRDIGRYRISPLESRYLKFGPWLAAPRPAVDWNSSIKILMRQTGDSLVAALDTNKYLCLNNMHVLVPIEAYPSPLYVLGILNSRLLNWYYHSLNPEVGEALAEVKKANVARLPIRAVDVSSANDKTQHDRMVGLVQRMATLQEELEGVGTSHEKTVVQRQVDAVDSQIDSLVYELYGLNGEEISIVEAADVDSRRP